MELDKVYLGDCLQLLRDIPDKSVDLVVTDPPYEIANSGGGGSQGHKVCKVLNECDDINILNGFNKEVLDECVRVLKKINMYVWCNARQIPMYFDYFVKDLGCKFDILVWIKDNAVPTYCNKYLTDKEYCLYFRKGGYCNPQSYYDARTWFMHPLNTKDKELWQHPTIKPLGIIKTLISNSSHEGDIVLDPFCGSGTTCVAAKQLGRHYIGMEIDEKYHKIAEKRIETETAQMTLW